MKSAADHLIFVGLGLSLLTGHDPLHILAAVALAMAWMLYRIERALLGRESAASPPEAPDVD